MIRRKAVARQKTAAADPTAAIARPVAPSATQCTHAIAVPAAVAHLARR